MPHYKRKISDKQMALFSIADVIPEETRRDKRPLPLIVAEKWDFPLTYVDTNGNVSDYLYCLSEWYKGLGGDKSRWSKSKDDWLTTDNQSPEKISVTMIETKRERRQPEMLEYVTEKGLYDLTQIMRVTKGNAERLKPIKDFLSISGIRIEEARRDKRKAKTLVKAIKQHHNPEREQGIKQRKSFMQIATETHRNHSPKHAILTNAIYHRIGRTVFEHSAKKEIVAILGLNDKQAKHFRDNINQLFDDAIRMAESASEIAFKTSGGNLTDEQQLAIVRQCSRIVAVSAWQLAEVAHVDLVTARPLIGKE